jgi:hypothetical protein
VAQGLGWLMMDCGGKGSVLQAMKALDQPGSVVRMLAMNAMKRNLVHAQRFNHKAKLENERPHRCLKRTRLRVNAHGSIVF